MRKKCFILTLDIFAGTNPFDEDATISDRDILTVCESLDDAYLYIDRMVKFNNDTNNRQRPENDQVTYTVDKPEYFQGREVDVVFKDADKVWTWQFSIFERYMFNPEIDKFDLKFDKDN